MSLVTGTELADEVKILFAVDVLPSLSRVAEEKVRRIVHEPIAVSPCHFRKIQEVV